MNGVVVIDKPPGLTSHDVVNRVRRILGQRSVGHLGTLDPSATGVLPIVLGNLTRLAQFYAHSEKTYEGVIRFGFATDTYDADGEPTSPPQDVHLNARRSARPGGPVSAAPSSRCRRRFPPRKLPESPPTNSRARSRRSSLSRYKWKSKNSRFWTSPPISHLPRPCGLGHLHTLGGPRHGPEAGLRRHLASLRRTAVAEFTIEDAHSLQALEAAMQQGSVESLFVHPRKLVPHLPSVTATEESAALIRSGRAVNLPEMSRAPQVKVFYGQRDLIAIATRIAGTLFHPGIVFSTENSSR